MTDEFCSYVLRFHIIVVFAFTYCYEIAKLLAIFQIATVHRQLTDAYVRILKTLLL